MVPRGGWRVRERLERELIGLRGDRVGARGGRAERRGEKRDENRRHEDVLLHGYFFSVVFGVFSSSVRRSRAFCRMSSVAGFICGGICAD